MKQTGGGHFDTLLHYSLLILKAKISRGTAVLSNLIDLYPILGFRGLLDVCRTDRYKYVDDSLTEDGEGTLRSACRLHVSMQVFAWRWCMSQCAWISK